MTALRSPLRSPLQPATRSPFDVRLGGAAPEPDEATLLLDELGDYITDELGDRLTG